MRARRCSEQTLQVLRALLDGPRRWRHGYDLAKGIGLSSGTLYPILLRLSDRGFLESKWQPAEQPGRPPRHAYRLTAKGAAYAEAELAACSAHERVTAPGPSRA